MALYEVLHHMKGFYKILQSFSVVVHQMPEINSIWHIAATRYGENLLLGWHMEELNNAIEEVSIACVVRGAN